MRSALSVVLALTAASTSTAAPLVWVGHLEDDSGPVDAATVQFTLRDGETVLIDETVLPELVAGDFVLELEVPDVLLQSTAETTLQIVANGEDFGRLPIARAWPQAAFASLAGHAAVADDASLLGGSGVTSRAALAAGEVPVAAGHVVDFPAAFLDGDAGIDLVPSARFTFTNGTLSLADGGLGAAQLSGTLSSADIATATVGGADISANSVNAAEASSIPLSAIVADTLRASSFSPGSLRTTLFEIVNDLCPNAGTLTVSSTCIVPDDCSGGDIRTCSGGCDTGVGVTNVCPNTIVGELVFK